MSSIPPACPCALWGANAGEFCSYSGILWWYPSETKMRAALGPFTTADSSGGKEWTHASPQFNFWLQNVVMCILILVILLYLFLRDVNKGPGSQRGQSIIFVLDGLLCL